MIVRPVDLPGDRASLECLDASFETDAVYRVALCGETFRVNLEPVPTMTKVFTIDDLARPGWQNGWVAIAGGRLVGFVASRYESWNRRVVIWHLYVDRSARRCGVGRALLEQALAEGRAQGARTAWLETQNVNAPAVAAYRAMGFELCGLDISLYRSTPAEGEIALFMARSLGPGS